MCALGEAESLVAFHTRHDAGLGMLALKKYYC